MFGYRAAARVRPRRARLGPALLGVALAGGCTTSGSAAPSPQTSPSTTRRADEAPRGSWRRIAEAPIPPAAGMAAAWTGRQLVVWGGQSGDGHGQPSGAGAAYDPGADRWEVLPP